MTSRSGLFAQASASRHLPQAYFASPYQFQRYGIIPKAAAIGPAQRHLIAPGQVLRRYGDIDGRLCGGKD